MRFPHAKRGIGKIYLGQVFEIIGFVLLAIGVGLGTLGLRTEGQVASGVTAGLAAGGMLTLVPGVFIPLIAMVLEFLGLREARVDEPNYLGKAYTITLAGIVLTIVSGFVDGAGINDMGICDLVVDLLQLFAFIYTISGISTLMGRVRRQDLIIKGNKIMRLFIAAQVAQMIANILGATFLGDFVSLIASVFSMVMLVMYLGFLRSAKAAL